MSREIENKNKQIRFSNEQIVSFGLDPELPEDDEIIRHSHGDIALVYALLRERDLTEARRDVGAGSDDPLVKEITEALHQNDAYIRRRMFEIGVETLDDTP